MSALGPRGFTVLSIAGIVGICLAVIGWGQRGTGLISPLVGAPGTTASASAAPSGPSAAPSGAASVAASNTALAGPSAAATGPKLSSEPYASFAFQVWPGPLSSDARLAMTGIALHVASKPGGISLNVVVDGQPASGASQFYASGAKVYVIDSNLGDEGGSVDYSLSDDGLIVTNAQGQVLQ